MRGRQIDLQFCVDHIAERAKYQANHLQKVNVHARYNYALYTCDSINCSNIHTL